MLTAAKPLIKWLAVFLAWLTGASSVSCGESSSGFTDWLTGFSYSVSSPLELSLAERDRAGLALLVKSQRVSPKAVMPGAALCRVTYFHSGVPLSLDAFAERARVRFGLPADAVSKDVRVVGQHETREIVMDAPSAPMGKSKLDLIFVGGKLDVVMFGCGSLTEEWPQLQQMMPGLLSGLTFE